MTDIHDFQQLVTDTLAQQLNLDQPTIYGLSEAVPIPEKEGELFHFWDQVHRLSSSTGWTTKHSSQGLSQHYQELLAVQPDSLLFKMARQNWRNPTFWLSDQAEVLPRYSPDLAEIHLSLQNGSSVEIELNEREHPAWASLFKEWLQALVEEPLKNNLIETIRANRLIVNLKWDSLVYLPFRPGNWLTAACLTYTFKNPSWPSATKDTNWETFFGEGGTFSHIVNQVLIGTRPSLSFRSMGVYEPAFAETLQRSRTQLAWPLFSSRTATNLHLQYFEDQSIGGTLSLASHGPFLLAWEKIPVQTLLGS